MSKKTLTILHLYPKDMNIYGDYGNVLVLKRRAEWHGYEVKVIDYNPGDDFPEKFDILVGGGGQDSGQDRVQSDLQKIGPKLKTMANNGTPMLVVCGLYQLFGKFFQTQTGHVIKGVGILDIETFAESERLIGNIVTKSHEFGEIVGYENHSGKTYIGNIANLGKVVKGAGNNGKIDKTEGARYKNVIGTYMHGSLLPKNPKIADWMISKAATNKYGAFDRAKIDDDIAKLAREHAMKRPR